MFRSNQAEVIYRIERIAERYSGISHDLKILGDILGSGQTPSERLCEYVAYTGMLAERFEALAATLERMNLAR